MQLEKSSVAADLKRLNTCLPLAARQARLPADTRFLHQEILKFLYRKARAPVMADFGDTLPNPSDLTAQLLALGSADLLVLDEESGMPLGAYPLTSEKTPHQIFITDRQLYAMCALDAVSVGPMFGDEIKIASSCEQTGIPISIRIRGEKLLEVFPDPACLIGIRWQSPGAIAAYSMCMQMVFLRDAEAANSWRNGDSEGVSLLSLVDAISLGSSFFLPLMAGNEIAVNAIADCWVS